jgi:hypothetical protein
MHWLEIVVAKLLIAQWLNCCGMLLISVTFDLKIPESVDNLSGPWLRSFVHKQMKLVMLGAAAFCWALWLSKNEVVFRLSKPSSFCR